ncbi:MAG: YbjN domain-containing protein [Paracoccaceae bacterium]|nr:YbjN domain-containing protein [Paracoccaceae bacterium]
MTPTSRIAAPILSLVSALALTAPAMAQSATDLLDGSDPEAILSIAQGYGSAMLDVDGVGDPKISGRIGGQAYTVFFYGCEGGQNCSSLQFTTWFVGVRPAAEEVSAWNDENRFGTMYLDGDGDLAVDLDVNLFGGVTRKNLDDTFDWWRVVLDEVRSEMVP